MYLDNLAEQFAGDFNSLVDPSIESDDTTFIKNITLGLVHQLQTTETMLRILKIFNAKTVNWIENKNLWLNEQVPSNKIEYLQTSYEYWHELPLVPILAKMDYPTRQCLLNNRRSSWKPSRSNKNC